jgi:hypothetical protein
MKNPQNTKHHKPKQVDILMHLQKIQTKQHIRDQIIYLTHLVFTSMFKFLDLNLKSMHVLSHICFFLPNILGLVIIFLMVPYVNSIDA